MPEWSAPGEKLLKGFVAKLDGERAKLIAFKEPTPPAPGPGNSADNTGAQTTIGAKLMTA